MLCFRLGSFIFVLFPHDWSFTGCAAGKQAPELLLDVKGVGYELFALISTLRSWVKLAKKPLCIRT